MDVKHYRDLIVWQKAMGLVVAIYKQTANFPTEEKYGLTNQMRRAAVSVPSNIAEGQCRPTRDFMRILQIARGSLLELETQILISGSLKYLDKSRTSELMKLTEEVSRLISGLTSSLSRNLQ